MSTKTVARPAPEPQALGPHWRRSFDLTMWMCLYVAKWFLLIMLVIGVGVALVYRYNTVPEVSIVQFGQQAGLWFGFSMMIMCGVMTPTYIMNGITRSGAATGSLVTAAGLAATFSMSLVLLLMLERPLFGALGWRAGLADDPNEPAAGYALPLLLFLFLLYWAGNVSGLLVHTAYYRLGGLLGTAALPLTLAPVLLAAVYGTNAGTPWGTAQDILPTALSLDLGVWQPALPLALIIVASAAHYRLTITMALAPKEA
ncbi:hypothetical protein ACI3EY_09030 [Ornithinimicrobium sp. LYQ92]|uniref:hypothetical protein n=1 Tax=Serinicoccus sp. LYQ92 TaxID=3378798 RepID=UPI0038552EF8